MTNKEFKILRRELGLTQAQLGKLLDIHPKSVSRKECIPGRIKPVEAHLLRALRHLTPAQRAELQD